MTSKLIIVLGIYLTVAQAREFIKFQKIVTIKIKKKKQNKTQVRE